MININEDLIFTYREFKNTIHPILDKRGFDYSGMNDGSFSKVFLITSNKEGIYIEDDVVLKGIDLDITLHLSRKEYFTVEAEFCGIFEAHGYYAGNIDKKLFHPRVIKQFDSCFLLLKGLGFTKRHKENLVAFSDELPFTGENVYKYVKDLPSNIERVVSKMKSILLPRKRGRM